MKTGTAEAGLRLCATPQTAPPAHRSAPRNRHGLPGSAWSETLACGLQSGMTDSSLRRCGAASERPNGGVEFDLRVWMPAPAPGQRRPQAQHWQRSLTAFEMLLRCICQHDSDVVRASGGNTRLDHACLSSGAAAERTSGKVQRPGKLEFGHVPQGGSVLERSADRSSPRAAEDRHTVALQRLFGSARAVVWALKRQSPVRFKSRNSTARRFSTRLPEGSLPWGNTAAVSNTRGSKLRSIYACELTVQRRLHAPLRALPVPVSRADRSSSCVPTHESRPLGGRSCSQFTDSADWSKLPSPSGIACLLHRPPMAQARRLTRRPTVARPRE